MKVIGFCGLPGSGKSTALEAIMDLGKIITMGDVIRLEAEKQNLEKTPDNLGKIAKELRAKGGSEIIARKCVDIINALEEDVVFIDGLRSLSEVEEFKKFWKFPIVAIDTPNDLRLKFLLSRGRSDDPNNQIEFRKRDDREREFGIIEVINNAEIKIKNDSTIENLKELTKKIVREIIDNY